MPESHVTHHLDQLAARITEQRAAGGPNIAPLLELEQGVIGDLTAAFPDIDTHLLGAVLLHLGGRAINLLNRLNDTARPQAGAILANVFQLAGQQLYTANPPAVWECPYTLVGGVRCTKVLTAPTEAELEPWIDGHLALSHPNTRRDRRA